MRDASLQELFVVRQAHPSAHRRAHTRTRARVAISVPDYRCSQAADPGSADQGGRWARVAADAGPPAACSTRWTKALARRRAAPGIQADKRACARPCCAGQSVRQAGYARARSTVRAPLGKLGALGRVILRDSSRRPILTRWRGGRRRGGFPPPATPPNTRKGTARAVPGASTDRQGRSLLDAAV